MPVTIAFSQGSRASLGIGLSQRTPNGFNFGFSVPGTLGGGDELIDVLAAENLPAFTIVTAMGTIADSTNLAHYGKVIGMTTVAVLAGNIARLADDDEVTNSLWAWSPGTKLFLNGTTISATPVSSGFSQLVAVARNATIVIVRLEPPVLL